MEKKKETSSIFSSKSAFSDKSNESGESWLALPSLKKAQKDVWRVQLPPMFVLQTDPSPTVTTVAAAVGCSPPTPAAVPCLTNHHLQRKVCPAEGALTVAEADASSLMVL